MYSCPATEKASIKARAQSVISVTLVVRSASRVNLIARFFFSIFVKPARTPMPPSRRLIRPGPLSEATSNSDWSAGGSIAPI